MDCIKLASAISGPISSRVGERENDENRFKKIPKMAGFVSPRLGIRFEPGEGRDNLRIFGLDGRRFLTFAELFEKSKKDERSAEVAPRRAVKQAKAAVAERRRADEQLRRADEEAQRADEQLRRADEEAQRADTERQRADEQRQRADEVEQRAQRLAAMLRKLGIEP